ncbi:MFS transporter, partial [Lacticaseibacillus rhamnosus]
ALDDGAIAGGVESQQRVGRDPLQGALASEPPGRGASAGTTLGKVGIVNAQGGLPAIWQLAGDR